MKKKVNFKYFFVFVIILFGFNIEVNAATATELTCLYKNGSLADKVMLVQQSDGKLIVYKHDKDADFDDDGWYVSKAEPKWGERNYGTFFGISMEIWDDTSDDKKITAGSLKECPKSMRTLKNGDGSIRFYTDEDGGDRKLEPDGVLFEAFTPKINEHTTIYGSTAGKRCADISTEVKWRMVGGTKHAASCLYFKDLDAGCHLILLDIDEEGGMHYTQVEPISSAQSMDFGSNLKSANINEVLKTYTGNCPQALYVNRTDYSDSSSVGVQIKTTLHFNEGAGRERYLIDDVSGTNLVTGEKLDLDTGVEIGFEKINILNCDQLFDGNKDLLDLLKLIINLIKIIVPLILIGLGTLDFAKAIFSGSEDDMKKVLNKFIKRVIIAVVIFLIPSLLKFVLGIANSIWGNIDADLCGLL